MEGGIGGQSSYDVGCISFFYNVKQKTVSAFILNLVTNLKYKIQNKQNVFKTKTKLKFSTTYGRNYISILYYVLCILYFNIHYVSSLSMMMFANNIRIRKLKFSNTHGENYVKIFKTTTADVFF